MNPENLNRSQIFKDGLGDKDDGCVSNPIAPDTASVLRDGKFNSSPVSKTDEIAQILIEFQKILSNPTKNLRRIKFLAMTKRMYIKVTPSTCDLDMPAVSLMSKKSQREITPLESFRSLISIVHTTNNQPGEHHLSAAETVMKIKETFTFGNRDFGMSEDVVRKTVVKCAAANCSAKLATAKELCNSTQAISSPKALNKSTDHSINLAEEQIYQGDFYPNI